MCGIATIFAYSSAAPPVDMEELLRIRDRMVSRGPDGSGAWLSQDGRVGLAHRRLAIIDLSEAGAQPMFSPDGRQAIVFNGEIYNYRELRRDLEGRGHLFRSESDTEVLLALYRDKGEGMLQDLRGMYAFAIWDEARQGMLLARDPFGIKPLYYADDGQTLRVASQVKALLAGGSIDTAPDPAGQAGFLLWGAVPEPHTLYRQIRALPPGNALWVERQQPGVSQVPPRREFGFCSIEEELARASRQPAPLAPADLRTALRDSVRRHLQADVPVVVFLSAGLDSGMLAALAAEVAPGSLHTVTLGFEEYAGTENDEVPLAERVAKHLGANHRTIWIKRDDFQGELPRLLDNMDQPSIDGVNSYFVSLATARAGFKVAISGLGGDELFGSYPSFRQVPRLARQCSLADNVPWLGRGVRLATAPWLGRFTSPKYAGLLEYGGCMAGAYLLRRALHMPWELAGRPDGGLLRQGLDELGTSERLAATLSGIASDHHRISALEMTWYMRNQLLRDTDWASMAHSLEVRVPFLDLDLLRSVSPCLGTPRSPDKRSAAMAVGNLPDEIFSRKKTGFTVPVREWLLGGSDLPGARGLRGWADLVIKGTQANA